MYSSPATRPLGANPTVPGIAAMLNSVRVRLTLWYTAALTCVLVVLAIATYVILRQNAMRRTDSALSELADSFLTTVNAELRDESGSVTLVKAAQERSEERRV